jgi:Flp pilus assembly CpaE family ATPase
VVAGIATAADWDELRPAEVVQVLRDLAGTSTLVVANVGGRCEALPGYGAVARFGVARAVLGEADEVAVVAAASPTGVLRLVEWAAAARSIVEPGKLHVVLNRHTGNRFAAGELMAEVRQTLGPRSVSVLPFDRRVVRAEWECVPAPSGPFARGAATLTSWVASS